MALSERQPANLTLERSANLTDEWPAGWGCISQEAMAGGPSWSWPRSPRPGHYSRNLTTPPPPKKKSMGSYGYQEPSGAKQTGTGQPQEQEALLGLSSEAEASYGQDEESGALTGSLSNRFHFCDRRGRQLGMASVAITRGAACPRRVSMDKQDKTR